MPEKQSTYEKPLGMAPRLWRIAIYYPFIVLLRFE